MTLQGMGQADPYGPVATPAEPEWLARKPTDARNRESRLRNYESKLIGLAAVVIFLAVWQGIGVIRAVWPEGVAIGPFTYVAPTQLFLPTPVEVSQAFGTYARDPKFIKDILTSGQELSYGYLLAAALAIPLGLLMGWYARFRYALDPFVTFLYATPRIVLLPLLIIWFGIGVESKVAVVFLGAFFAMIINTTAGVRNLDVNLIKVARSFGASDLQLFRTVALPGSVPFILTGLRLGIGHALTGVVVGEAVAAQFGVGQMMFVAGATFQSSKVFAGLVLIAGAGMLMTFTLQWLERRFDAWRPRPN
jgi:ABC-type nitrate/sulfonate/bicarbonate transport system permease component